MWIPGLRVSVLMGVVPLLSPSTMTSAQGRTPSWSRPVEGPGEAASALGGDAAAAPGVVKGGGSVRDKEIAGEVVAGSMVGAGVAWLMVDGGGPTTGAVGEGPRDGTEDEGAMDGVRLGRAAGGFS